MSIIALQQIENRILTIREAQVMVDFHLAEFYGVETKRLNEQVKRNVKRFPQNFMFQLTIEEWANVRSQFAALKQSYSLKSQFATLENQRGKHRKFLPHVFTEQGVAMLSAVLNSDVAIEASIQIMQAFVNYRKFILQNASVFQRLDQLEIKQLQTDEKVERIFLALDAGQKIPEKGIFFDGQIFDSYTFIAALIKNATREIILIDNFVDETTLSILSKRKETVTATIYTKTITKALSLELEKHNAQYPPITINTFAHSHDRFLLIDGKELYHIGASLKDLGKKWFAFSRMDSMAAQVLDQLQKQLNR